MERGQQSLAQEFVTIYVRLLDEGTAVARPTQALRLSHDRFKLMPTPGYDPTDENWEFPPGSVVEAERQRWASGEILVAVRVAHSLLP